MTAKEKKSHDRMMNRIKDKDPSRLTQKQKADLAVWKTNRNFVDIYAPAVAEANKNTKVNTMTEALSPANDSSFVPPAEEPGAISKLYDYLTPPKDESTIVVDSRMNPISDDLRSFFGYEDGVPVAAPVAPSVSQIDNSYLLPQDDIRNPNGFAPADTSIPDVVSAPQRSLSTGKGKASPQVAPQAQVPAPNPYSMNPFASNFSPSAFRDGLGSQRSDVQNIPGAAAYEGQRGYVSQQQQQADAAKLMDPRLSKILDQF